MRYSATLSEASGSSLGATASMVHMSGPGLPPA